MKWRAESSPACHGFEGPLTLGAVLESKLFENDPCLQRHLRAAHLVCTKARFNLLIASGSMLLVARKLRIFGLKFGAAPCR